MGTAGAPAPAAADDIGPKPTPIGSPATLIPYDQLRRRGVSVPWRAYPCSGWIPTPAVLAAFLAALH